MFNYTVLSGANTAKRLDEALASYYEDNPDHGNLKQMNIISAVQINSI